MCSVDSKPLFRDLTAEDPDPEVTTIESMCMNCHQNGETRLLLTRIPYFKNVVLMSFSCEHCGYENNEIQPGGAYAEMGVRWTLKVEGRVDLDRQVVKSDFTSVKIPEVELEIPAQSQKGEITTVEGILTRAISGIAQQQEARRAAQPDEAALLDAFIDKLRVLAEGRQHFTMQLEDISGNTFVENPEIPRKDPRCSRADFKRTAEQDHLLGIFTQDEVSETQPPDTRGSILTPADPTLASYERLQNDEVLTFACNCPDCNAPADTRLKLTDIPYFKQVLIMATVCEACGHRTNEVKSGGGIEEKGVRFEVRIRSREDFSRDILKSETCSMEIPELELEVGGRALGGRFSTAEGLLRATRDQLADGPGAGDAPAEADIDVFLGKIDEVLAGKREVTIILDDPAGNSYVQSLNDEDPTLPDEGLKITRYERTFDQNEELGLNDMKTEGYENETLSTG